jgi:diguanylate cyclase (GGDEF)-like protein
MAKANRRHSRRNPSGTFADMQRKSDHLESGMRAFEAGKISGKALLKRAAESVVAKSRVSRMLRLDPKFEIENDAAFNERLFKFLRSSRAREPFSFAILDLDFLKQLNTMQGYAAADRAIALFAKGVSGIAKKNGGFAGRFGGDELKIFVPKEPFVLAEALKGLLAGMRESGLSFSAGVTSSDRLGGLSSKKQVEVLNQRANTALNASKGKGRARVSFF